MNCHRYTDSISSEHYVEVEEGKMTTVKCIKCGNSGYLMAKQTVTKGMNYHYWYVKHLVNKKIKWRYIGKTLPEYESLVPQIESTQTGTQKTIKQNNLKSDSISQSSVGRSSSLVRTLALRAHSLVAFFTLGKQRVHF